MPVWYLILSAIIGLGVIGGVAYAEFNSRRQRKPEAGVAGEFDATVADTPTHREAETDFVWQERREAERTTAR